MTVAENMAFALRMQRLSKAEIQERTRSAAELLGIRDLLERKPRQLSGGQRQRVALGRAIVREPQAFLMDEPPQVLYSQPADVFVAGFIGSPAMNLVIGRVSDAPELTLELGSSRLALNDEVLAERPALRAYAGREVIVGIRPEAIAVSGNGHGPTLERPVVMTEALGADVLVHLDLDAPASGTADELAGGLSGLAPGHSMITARMAPSAAAAAGRQLPLLLDPRRLHFFDPASGAAIRG
jgi:multiple sugar transport system ATP-binding protein